MNESQERREELLRMSRQKWRKGSIPAVHPRYQHVYRGLYGEHSSEENGGSSFFARMFISFLIFGMVCGGRLYRRENLEIYALTDRVTD